MRRARRTRALVLLLACTLSTPAFADPPPEEPPSSISVFDARVLEGSDGLAICTFTVRLDPVSSATVSFDFATEDGTATVADNDYYPTSGRLEIPAGDSVATIVVAVQGDTRLEGNEWFRLRLSNASQAAFADSEGFGVIVNDESPTFDTVDPEEPPYYDGTLPNAWGDADGDGVPDLPLYRGNPDGTLSEMPGFRQLLKQGNYHGVAWCDYDRDGDLDLVLIGYTTEGVNPTPLRLLRNDGPAGFVDASPSLGPEVLGSGETAVWADFDGDGWPDLFAPYYSFQPPFRSFLFHNDGQGGFIERADSAGVSLPNIPIELRPEGAVAGDWNGDGHLDLYCASHLFLNDGTGNFTDARDSLGMPIVFDEGASFVDYDGDGDLDLYLRAESGPRLFRNDGAHITETTSAAGFDTLSIFWGDRWLDADGDGDLDLLVMPYGPYMRLMLNMGDGTFVRDTLFDQLQVRTGLVACADIDGDGDVDFVSGADYLRMMYLSRQAEQPGFDAGRLAVRVLDNEGHQTEYGATVRLIPLEGPPGRIQTRLVDGGSGLAGQDEYPVRFFGLGAERYALEVAYPSPAGSRVVVDSLVQPMLGRLDVNVRGLEITVRPNGAISAVTNSPTAVGSPLPHAGQHRRLGPATPTPAHQVVSFALALDRAARVTLDIHDLHGRRIRRLDAGTRPAGTGSIGWDLADERGARVPPGVYFGVLSLDGRMLETARVLVVR